LFLFCENKNRTSLPQLPKHKDKKKWQEIRYINSVHTITADNGTEFVDHQNIAKLLKANFFFTHPYSSWEKGLIENTNKLVRQYIPKGTNFNAVKQQKIKEIQYKTNNRPRQKLNFYSPKEIFFLNLRNQKIALGS